ncbi:MAG TPA: phenylalanine--tRNA ligase subunit beta [Candidatus Absconditabacterales bacterium]|nr:phenylalanine--tRNA ligase subunit beta [Candidatus Absconditabacterales bacterium]
MKYSSNLLKKFISVNDSVENIADKFTLKTVEVEEIIQRKIDKNIVVGKIKSVEKHPDADRLNVCMVNCGAKGEYQIICGGTNVEEGIYVPTALPGTFFEKAGIKIEARKMRGVESNGMICSKAELEIQEDVDTHWIWNIGNDLDDLTDNDLGISLIEKYPWLESKVIDVDNKGLTNRPDLTGHFGMAVELNGMYDSSKISYNKITEYFDTFKNTNIIELLDSKEKTKIGLKGESDNLNSYILMELKDISVKKSTFFTRMQMLDLGNNPINNWVDFSNLFMNITGQPIHFFDADKVSGNIIIRQAKKGEKFVDLFEKEHELLETDMVIADDDKILALAGVVGGLDSGVTDNTKNILVEIANFDPVCVRKTGVRLGLRTDAELRYEKNINPVFSLYVFLLFLDLLKYYQKDLGSYQIGGLSYYKNLDNIDYLQNNISLDFEKMESFIFGKQKEGIKDDVKNLLKGIGFDLTFEGEKVSVGVPFWRSQDDINIVEDVYEEIARLYGYENIEPVSLKSEVSLSKTSNLIGLIRKIEETFVRNYDFDQVETYPWVDEKSLNLFGVDLSKIYKLKNPIDTDKPWMRNDLDYVLIKYISKNFRFFDKFKIFDIGRVWSKDFSRGDYKSKFADGFVGEKIQLSAMSYQKDSKNWSEDLLLNIKGEVENLFKTIGLKNELVYSKTQKKAYHPKKQGNIFYGEDLIGFVGSIHPLVLKENKIGENSDLVYLSLDIEKIDELVKKVEFKPEGYETLQDQIVWRDLCFVLDQKDDYGLVLDSVKNIKDIDDVDVFDLYKGENLPEGKKSVAFKIKIKGENLQTEQINQVMNSVIKKIESTGAKLRE